MLNLFLTNFPNFSKKKGAPTTIETSLLKHSSAKASSLFLQPLLSIEAPTKFMEFVKRLDPDFAIFTPLTSLPGTPLYEWVEREGWLVVRDFSRYDFAHTVMRTKELSPEEVQRLMNLCYQKFFARTSKVLRGIFSRNRHRRAIVRYFLKKSLLP